MVAAADDLGMPSIVRNLDMSLQTVIDHNRKALHTLNDLSERLAVLEAEVAFIKEVLVAPGLPSSSAEPHPSCAPDGMARNVVAAHIPQVRRAWYHSGWTAD